jgi:glycosyltransferase involved in cell wall biosynthesis
MSNKKLTVCIPSFNRPEAAKNSVSKLLKQLNGSNIKVKVIDNGSEKNYSDEFIRVGSFKNALENGTLSIVRNPYNIGMSANFMRCFEVAEGDWLWMVADDDDLRSDALASVVTVLEGLPDACGLVAFGGEAGITLDSVNYIENFEDFIDLNYASIENFNRFIFITNGIYALNRFRPLLSVGYQYLNTFIPHFMMQLAYMQNRNSIAVVQKKIVDYVVPESGYSYSLVAGLGVGAPKHALIKTDTEHYKKYLSLFFPHNDYKVLIDLYYICKRDASLYVCQRLAKNYLYYVSDARSFFKILVLRVFILLLRFPLIFERLMFLGGLISDKFEAHASEIRKRYR